MKNVILLQKDKDGNIYCKQITKKGVEYSENLEGSEGFWEEGGTVLLEEIEEILDKDI